MTNSQLDTTNESQEVSRFPAGDHKAHINRRAQRHSKHKTEQKIKGPQKKYRLGTVSTIFYWRAKTGFKPNLNEILCQLAALFSELLMLCGSVDQKVIFATLFVCRLLMASAAYFDVMYVIVVCCQTLVLNDALYLLL